MSDSLVAGMRASASLRVVLLGDIHTYRLGVWPWELLGKPLAGQVNLWLNRRRRFDRSLISPTVDRALSLRPDLVLMSGDLTTTARPSEFNDVARALHPLLQVAPVMLIPGNHDVYTYTARRRNRIRGRFADCVPESFPTVRRLIGGWRLLAVNAAGPRMFDSRGRIGERQLREVEAILNSMSPVEGTVILCHYPFGKPPNMIPMKTGHRLLDEDRWREVIGCSAGRIVLVHGHVHCPWLWRVQGMRNVLDVNAGAPTMTRRPSSRGRIEGTCGQGFWEMTLATDVGAPIQFAHHVMMDRPDSNPLAGIPALSGLAADWQVDEQETSGSVGPVWVTRRIVAP
jgi:3',5'-cyclic AMP phosphodiesterase CpdA